MSIQSIYAFLENKASCTEETEKALEEIVSKYPWFAGGQLLNALAKKKLKRPEADEQLGKAQIFLSNPLWANWQMINMEQEGLPELADSDPIISAQQTLTAKTNEESEKELSFEPLYTIDYFASQGIRLQQEQLGNDKFSHQVKTFTQWLQSMKKIYQSGSGNMEKTEDKKITSIADASNETQDIITETMADVLMQQGKNLQAIEILEKLSLLHPEKSSYFTARISELSK